MSYDLMVFDPETAPRERAAFLDWYRLQVKWAPGQYSFDPAFTTPNLSAWYADIRRYFPNMNGPDAYDFKDHPDDARITDYSIGRFIIYAAFAWSKAEGAYRRSRALAEAHGVGFYDVSGTDGEIWFPPVIIKPI